MQKINPIVIKLLKKRGIETEEDITEFLSEKPQRTYDPFLLPDMEAGVDLILSKIRSHEKICIYGDYDADGITSTALLWHMLSNLTDNISYYIPSRFNEGYGLNKEAIRSIRESGAGLIITVDCGSVSYDETVYAKETGIDIIVTDHHSMNEKRADCLLINPKRKDSLYPYRDLAGVGVAFKLAQALRERAGLERSVVNRLLDIAAVGTIGDIVPLTDENRTIVKYGLRMLNSVEDRSLDRLIEGISLKKGFISSDNVAFGIVPHLNAAGRMLDARIAADLLITDDDDIIEERVGQLIENNRKRKKVQDDTYEKCIDIIENEDQKDGVIIVRSDDIHEGIAGIVAGKLKERYGRPAMILTPSGENGGSLKGTSRSIEKIDLYELLKTCEDLFEKFGGHKGACGFTLKKENFDEFRKRINSRIKDMLRDDKMLFEKEIHFDADIDISDIDAALADDIEVMQPFGSENPRPVFRTKAQDICSYSYMGQNGQHVRFNARGSDGSTIGCVMFNGKEKFESVIKKGMPVYIFGSPEDQIWNGRKRLQFIVSDIDTAE